MLKSSEIFHLKTNHVPIQKFMVFFLSKNTFSLNIWSRNIFFLKLPFEMQVQGTSFQRSLLYFFPGFPSCRFSVIRQTFLGKENRVAHSRPLSLRILKSFQESIWKTTNCQREIGVLALLDVWSALLNSLDCHNPDSNATKAFGKERYING